MNDDTVIDLDAVATASAQLAAWWAYFSSTGDPALPQLDQARRALTLLPPLPGPLGQAVRLIASDSTHATRSQLQAAIERISKFGGRRHTIRPVAHVVHSIGPVEQLELALGDHRPNVEADHAPRPVRTM